MLLFFCIGIVQYALDRYTSHCPSGSNLRCDFNVSAMLSANDWMYAPLVLCPNSLTTLYSLSYLGCCPKIVSRGFSTFPSVLAMLKSLCVRAFVCLNTCMTSSRDQFINGSICSGTDDRDTTSCVQCTPQLSPRHFTNNACNGRTRADQQWLSCADRCMAGEYVSKQCSNTSQTQCAACKISCAAGYYMQGSCDGTTSYDSVQCIPCRESCAAGQHRVGLDRCLGNTTVDTVSCAPCRTQCQVGQYIFGTCTGLGTIDETSCKQCTVCPRDRPSAYNSIYRSCNGSDTEDIVVCALNAPGSTMVGDVCPAGHFVAGRLDGIDLVTEQTKYNCILPMLNQFSDAVLHSGEYMLVSFTTPTGGTTTKLQLFQVWFLLFVFAGPPCTMMG